MLFNKQMKCRCCNRTILAWETTRSITPPESPEAPLAGARESSSSKKITQGRADLACKWLMMTFRHYELEHHPQLKLSQNNSSLLDLFFLFGNGVSEKIGKEPFTFWKMSRTFFSDSPMYMLISSGPFTLRKFREHSVATALANKVWDLQLKKAEKVMKYSPSWNLARNCAAKGLQLRTYFPCTRRTIKKNTRAFTQSRWKQILVQKR